MQGKQIYDPPLFTYCQDVDDLVPKTHFLKKIDSFIDMEFVRTRLISNVLQGLTVADRLGPQSLGFYGGFLGHVALGSRAETLTASRCSWLVGHDSSVVIRDEENSRLHLPICQYELRSLPSFFHSPPGDESV